MESVLQNMVRQRAESAETSEKDRTVKGYISTLASVLMTILSCLLVYFLITLPNKPELLSKIVHFLS